MKFEIEKQDVEVIAQRVLELLRPVMSTNQAKKDDNDSVLDVKGLSEYLKVDSSWVYKQVSQKTIPYFKIGKYTRFKKSAIDRWIENKTLRPVPFLK